MKGLLVVGLCVIVIGVVTGFIGEAIGARYSGKEIFQTEAEYSQFKQDISLSSVTITEMQALSSSPPIVVTFDVRVRGSDAFTYGKEDTMYNWWGAVLFGGIGVLLIFGAVMGRKIES